MQKIDVCRLYTFLITGTRVNIVCSFSLNLERRCLSASLWMWAASSWTGLQLFILSAGFSLDLANCCSASFCRSTSSWIMGTIFSVHRRNNDCRGEAWSSPRHVRRFGLHSRFWNRDSWLCRKWGVGHEASSLSSTSIVKLEPWYAEGQAAGFSVKLSHWVVCCCWNASVFEVVCSIVVTEASWVPNERLGSRRWEKDEEYKSAWRLWTVPKEGDESSDLALDNSAIWAGCKDDAELTCLECWRGDVGA